MRIRVITASDIVGDGIAERTCRTLTEEIESARSAILTDENPDVIHVIGGWDTHSIAAAREAQTKRIAWVHTPLGSISPWFNPSSSHMRLSMKATMLVASGAMEQELLDEGDRDNLRLILNATTTATTTAQEMASAYMEVYSEAAKITDKGIWDDIDAKMKLLNEHDGGIIGICRNLLYAQYLHKRGSIPRKFLDGLSSLMTSSDYDEDHMADILRLISLYDFTQRLEYAMQERSTLTEGFMPIPLKDDKEARDILGKVTDYE